MTTLIVDGKTYTAHTAGRNLLEVCLSLGLNVPYFCWHPAFRSVGACRQCAVKVFRDERDVRGHLEMACMIPVADGMRVAINDPEAVAFRAKVIEWLMVNHPHDCPVCDEGGECHLQDMTVMTGHVHRSYKFSKRTHRDQDLGPFVHMEMNRCIQCYRCVRFYRDYAGGRDFDVHGWHDHVYFGRHEDGILESPFSGNLVEVCPTGVFTDKVLKRSYTRKWDLQTAPSVCPHCGLGCNTIPGERYGMVRRIMPRYNGEVNGYFLCDRGRYGYAFTNDKRRLRRALHRGNGEPVGVSRDEALALATNVLQNHKVIGIGSPRASLEANFALRTLVGPQRFYHGVAERELRLVRTLLDLLRRGPARTPSLHEVESCDAVLILGEDVTQTAPLLELALRQAVLQKPKAEAMKLGIYEWLDASLRDAMQDQRGPLVIASTDRTTLDALASKTVRAAPSDLARLGFAVAHALDPMAPPVTGLAPETLTMAEGIAAALRTGKRPLVVSGYGCGSEAVAEAAANVAWALCRTGSDARLCFTAPECNSFGAAMLPGESLDAAVAEIRNGTADAVIVLENDLHRRLPADAVDALLGGVRQTIVLDHLDHATTARANLVLPTATFAEAGGTYVNNEGRAQRLFQVLVPGDDIQASWRWLADLMAPSSRAWKGLDDLLAALADALPEFKEIPGIAPPADFRMAGRKVPRQPARYSGRTAITAHLSVQEPKPPDDPDAPLAFSMEGSPARPPASLLTRFWAPQWNSVQAVNKFQVETGGALQGGDPSRRLIEPPAGVPTPYSVSIPGAFAPRTSRWLIVPAWHIFGSDELSVHSPGIAARVPKPYVALHPNDMARLGLEEGQEVTLSVGIQSRTCPVVASPGLPIGVARTPAGLPGLPVLVLPAWGSIAVTPLSRRGKDAVALPKTDGATAGQVAVEQPL